MHIVVAVTLVATGLVTLGAALWVRRRGRGASARVFAGLLVVDGLWPLVIALQLFVREEAAKVLLFQAAHALEWLVPATWLVFVLYYTGRERWLSRPVWALVGAEYALITGLTLTNHWHRLVWSDYGVVAEPFPHLVATGTAVHGVQMVVQYAYVVAGLVLLFRLFFTAQRVSRRQPAGLFVAAAIPVGINVAQNAGALPAPNLEYTAVGSGLFGVVAAWSLYGQRLMDIEPLARNRLFDDLVEPVLVVDGAYRVVDYNESARRVVPELDGSIGRRLDELLPALFDRDVPDDPVADERPGAAGEGDEESPFAASVTLALDGEPQTFTVSVSPLSCDGDNRGYAIVLRDVTELRRYAAVADQQTNRLEHVGHAVSHELRNPLNVAQGYLQEVRESTDDPAVEQVAESLDRMETIIDEVLSLARTPTAERDLELVELEAVARSAWQTTDTRAASLSLEVPPGLAVYAQPTRLRTLFENLFRNAVEHGSTSPRQAGDAVEHGSTGSQNAGRSGDAVEHGSGNPRSAVREGASLRGADGGPTVIVGAFAGAPGRATVAEEDPRGEGVYTRGGFFVEDDGPGIPPDRRGQVFEYGYTTSEEGTGLGLFTVSSIAREHGWDVSVTDGSAGGARFVFSNVEWTTVTGDSADDGPPDGEPSEPK